MCNVVNKSSTSRNCVVQDETERPKLGNRIAGPYATRQEAENKKRELVRSDECG